MKFKSLLFCALTASSVARATTIAQWNFDSNSIVPSAGSGTASLIGGTTATFTAGNGAGSGWNTTSYPAQSTASGTAGVQFAVSTLGQSNIAISFDHRASGTASRFASIEYTTDGTSWIVFGNNSGGLSPSEAFYSFSYDLSAIAAVNNNANFAFRVVSIFSPLSFDQNSTLADFAANSAYMRASSESSFTAGGAIGTGNYGTTGTWRFDNVTVRAIPEPSAALLGAFGLFASLRRRR
jgi:hypothetical protein